MVVLVISVTKKTKTHIAKALGRFLALKIPGAQTAASPPLPLSSFFLLVHNLRKALPSHDKHGTFWDHKAMEKEWSWKNWLAF